jgi:hypothetical protein
MARITISFKNTEKDKKLFEYWDSLEDKSVEIKIILRKEMEKRENLKNNNSKEGKSKDTENVGNILNF